MKVKIFKSKMRKLRFSVGVLFLFNIILNTFLVYLITYLIFSLLNFYKLEISIIAALVYFLGKIHKISKINKLKYIEEEYPEFREKIITSYDHADSRNIMASHLKNEVMFDINKVFTSKFFNENKFFVKVLAIVGLSFMIVFVAPYINFDIKDFLQNGFNKLNAPDIFGEDGGKLEGESGEADKIVDLEEVEYVDELEVELKDAEPEEKDLPLFGDEYLVKLAKKRFKVRIDAIDFEVRLGGEEESEKFDFEGDGFAEDITPSAEKIYEENIAREDQEVVKNYFETLANS